ncbi:MAG: radical SAM protein [Prevotellaceae bacterium]|jgi:wyosine [tRNA(Phe)-imidazoG37] synthetase (radical SAM superfamily)|nr:radical SAM protein [Prevotellaceae bacterium]
MLQHKSIFYGPVQSRRLGISLGVNLQPTDAKICSFNCLYCECGFNTGKQKERQARLDAFTQQLEDKLITMYAEHQPLDTITFAGNGEPTMHPKFPEIIDITISLRNKYYPMATISVLTNSTEIHRLPVFNALKKIDNPILKFDSAIEKTLEIINRPVQRFHNRINPQWLVEKMACFKGNFIVQTMFLRGSFDGESFDNTTSEEVRAWLNVLCELRPRQVMIYTIARETPISTLQKVSREELEEIAEKVRKIGIEVSISA